MITNGSAMALLLEEKRYKLLTVYLKGPRKFVGFQVVKITETSVTFRGERDRTGKFRVLCVPLENIEAFTYDESPNPQKEQEGPDDPESDTEPQEEEEISPDDAEEEGVSNTPPKDDGGGRKMKEPNPRLTIKTKDN
jgi:hypothetical protein